jgi:hypothetical protein
MMVHFIIYENGTGKIQRTGYCEAKNLPKKILQTQTLILGKASIDTDKIENGQVVKKTPADLAAEQPVPIPIDDQEATITNKAWQDVLDRVAVLENKP